jgi:hypothetical protein
MHFKKRLKFKKVSKTLLSEVVLKAPVIFGMNYTEIHAIGLYNYKCSL